MSVLTAVRDEVRDDLKAAGIKAVSYVGEQITPPCVVVVPGQPYLTPDTDSRTFGNERLVTVDLLLPVGQSTPIKEAVAVDDLIQSVLDALDDLEDWELVRVAQPGTATLRGAKYLASVVTIRRDIES